MKKYLKVLASTSVIGAAAVAPQHVLGLGAVTVSGYSSGGAGYIGSVSGFTGGGYGASGSDSSFPEVEANRTNPAPAPAPKAPSAEKLKQCQDQLTRDQNNADIKFKSGLDSCAASKATDLANKWTNPLASARYNSCVQDVQHRLASDNNTANINYGLCTAH